jgi:hypothetical protein
MTPPMAGAVMRAHLSAALFASCLPGALPSPVERAVCSVRALVCGQLACALHFAWTTEGVDSGIIPQRCEMCISATCCQLCKNSKERRPAPHPVRVAPRERETP